MSSRSLTLGYFVLALAQVAISVNVVISKFLISGYDMSMFFLLTARFGISSLFLGLFMLVSRTSLRDPRHPQSALTQKDWFLGILSGFFAAFLFNLFFVWGLQYTTATASGIVASTLPAIVAISAVWFLNERLNSAKVSAVILAMIGILVINLDHFETNVHLEHTYFGDFLVFLAMLPEAWYSIISRKLANRITPLGAAFIANIVGFVCFLPCALFTSSFSVSALSTPVCLLILLAGFTSLLFFWAWGWGLSFIPASTAAIFGGVMPVATTCLAILFLGETLRWYDTVGMLLVLASIVIGTGWHMRIKKAIPTTP